MIHNSLSKPADLKVFSVRFCDYHCNLALMQDFRLKVQKERESVTHALFGLSQLANIAVCLQVACVCLAE